MWVCAPHEAPEPCSEPSGTAHEACAQVERLGMTGRTGMPDCQLAGLSQLHTPLCLLSSRLQPSSLLHTRRTVIVLIQLLRGLNQRIYENHLAQCLVMQGHRCLPYDEEEDLTAFPKSSWFLHLCSLIFNLGLLSTYIMPNTEALGNSQQEVGHHQIRLQRSWSC